MTTEMSATDNINAFEINNIQRRENSHVYPSHWPHKCCMNLKVSKRPNFIYHDLGKYLVAHDKETGFVHSYEYIEGSSQGFGGASISLPIYGEISEKKFVGCLWDTSDAKLAAEEYFGIKTVSIGWKLNSDWNGCYTASQIDKKVFNEILNLTGLAIVKPTYHSIKEQPHE